jgi:hypothetical protein
MMGSWLDITNRDALRVFAVGPGWTGVLAQLTCVLA